MDVAVVVPSTLITIDTGDRVTQFQKGTIQLMENTGDGTFRTSQELDLGDKSLRALIAFCTHRTSRRFRHLNTDTSADL